MYTYDSLGKLIAIKEPNMDSAVKPNIYSSLSGEYSKYYIHDESYNLIEMIDSERDIKYEYDGSNRIVASYDAAGDNRVDYLYDSYIGIPSPKDNSHNNPYGRLTAILAPSVNTYFYYDAEGRICETNTEYTDNVVSLWFLYEYDRSGNLELIKYPDGEVVEYEYDDFGRITNLKIADETVAYQSYGNNVADEEEFSFPNLPNELYFPLLGISNSITYNKRNWISKISSQDFKADYIYDNDGNLLKDSSYDKENKLDEQAMYVYDAKNQLESYTYDIGGLKEFKYSYDLMGNRLEESSGGELYTYEYDALNKDKLERIKNNGNIQKEYIYDGIGNVIKIDDQSSDNRDIEYEYNYFQNRPSRVIVKNGGTTEYDITYLYDSLGNRIKSIVTDKINKIKKTVWHLRGLNNEVLYEAEILQSTSIITKKRSTVMEVGVENSEVDLKMNSYYFFGDNRIVQKTDNQLSYYVRDRLSNTRKIVNENQNKNYDYHPFGTLIDNESDTNFLFTNSEYDKETNNYYLFARYLDTITGRFLSTDPIRKNSSLYTYCLNNPLKYNDRNGMVGKIIKVYTHIPKPGPSILMAERIARLEAEYALFRAELMWMSNQLEDIFDELDDVNERVDSVESELDKYKIELIKMQIKIIELEYRMDISEIINEMESDFIMYSKFVKLSSAVAFSKWDEALEILADICFDLGIEYTTNEVKE